VHNYSLQEHQDQPENLLGIMAAIFMTKMFNISSIIKDLTYLEVHKYMFITFYTYLRFVPLQKLHNS
jgi:hypothetical protein